MTTDRARTHDDPFPRRDHGQVDWTKPGAFAYYDSIVARLYGDTKVVEPRPRPAKPRKAKAPKSAWESWAP